MRLRFCIVLMLVCALSSACFAEEAAEAVDERLDQKITYSAKGLTLHKVLEELTEKTGVTMTCGLNEKDWQVRDRKVSIFVTEITLGTVQKTLGRLLRFTWSRGQKDGVYTYRLFQDLKSRNEEEALRNVDAEAEAKRLVDRRISVLDQMDKVSSLAPEDLEKLKKDSPFLYLLGKEPFGQALAEMMRTIPNARSAFADGRDVTLPMSSLPQQAANATENLINGIDSFVGRFARPGDSHAGLLNSLSHAQFKLKFPTDLPAEAMHAGLLGEIEITAEGQRTFEMPLLDPTSPMANMMAKAALRLADGEPMEQVGDDMRQEGMKLMTGPATPSEEDEKLPDDPALDKRIKLDVTQPEMPGVLEQLAKKSEMNVVSDYFVERRRRMPKTEGTLREVLKSIGDTYGKRVKMSGSLITFEDRKWYEKRSWEVPEALLEQWKARAKEGKLDFDDLVSISCLTDAQLQHTIMLEQRLTSAMGFGIYQVRQILRLYSLLSPAQKSALNSTGLDCSGFDDDQWAYLVAAEPTAHEKAETGSLLTLHVELDPESGARTFRLDETRFAEDGSPTDPAQLKGWLVPEPRKAPSEEKKPEQKKPGN